MNSEVECSNPGSTTFYKMIDFVLFNTFFRFQLKYTRRFSFQISNLVLRTLSRSVNISKIFVFSTEYFFNAVVSPEGKLYAFVLCHGAL